MRVSLSVRVEQFLAPFLPGLLQFGEVHDVTYQDVVYIENLTGGRYVEEEDEVFRYRRAFDRLSDLALDEQKSREILVAARDTWT